MVLTEAGREIFEAAAPKHAAWVGTVFFSDIDGEQQDQLADILGAVYESILRHGTLPRPDLDEDRPRGRA